MPRFEDISTWSPYEKSTPCNSMLKLSLVQAFCKCDKSTGGWYNFVPECRYDFMLKSSSYMEDVFFHLVEGVCYSVLSFHNPLIDFDVKKWKRHLYRILRVIGGDNCFKHWFNTEAHTQLETFVDNIVELIYKPKDLLFKWYQHFVSRCVKSNVQILLLIVCDVNYLSFHDGSDMTQEVCDKLTNFVHFTMAKNIAEWSQSGHVTMTQFFKHLRHPF
jgi:hypothetical protein